MSTDTDNVLSLERRKQKPVADVHYRVPVRRGSVDVYFAENEMASLDACLPTPLVKRLLEVIRGAR